MEGVYSDWEEVVSGVIQGLVIGGTGFNVYIDDIDQTAMGAHTWKFADDSKIAKIVENEEDGRQVQRILDNLEEWAKK